MNRPTLFVVGLLALGCGDSDAETGTSQSAETAETAEAAVCTDCAPPDTIVEARAFHIPEGTCATYVGNHLKYPAGEHSQKYEFCADGSMTKWWNPVPGMDPPGDLECTGTWEGDGTGFVDMRFDCGNAGFPNNAIEIYGLAFMYEDGSKLDLHEGKRQVTPGDGSTLAGTYTADSSGLLDMGEAFMVMDMESEHHTTVHPDGTWENVETETLECAGLFCAPEYNGTADAETSGTLQESKLFKMGDVYVLQPTKHHVLTRQ